MHHLGDHDCNTSHWSRSWPNQADVCIFLAHTIPVRNLAKHGHRKYYTGNLLRPFDADDEPLAPELRVGACGHTLLYDDVIISQSIFDAHFTGFNQSANPLCGRKLRASGNGYSVDLTVADRCKCTGLRQPCDRDWRIDQ